MGASGVRRLVRVLTAAILAAGLAGAVAPPSASRPAQAWLASWGTAHQQTVPDGATAFALSDVLDRTVRMFVTPAVGGSAVRLRMSNAESANPIVLGRVAVAVRQAGTRVRPGTTRVVHFGGRTTLHMAPGAEVVSDPVPLTVAAGEDLAVSVHVVQAAPPYSGHVNGKQISFIASLPGDRATDEVGADFDRAAPSWLWVRGVDVLTTPRPVVVAIGDSITDGHLMPPEGHLDWPSVLRRSLGDRASVVNAGISGNTVTRLGCRPCGPALVDRFERDVLSVPGVTHVVVLAGTNDLRAGVSPQRVSDGLLAVARRAQRAGVRVLMGTVVPRDDLQWGWDRAAHNPARQALNAWVRSARAFEVVDFDAAVRDPRLPDQLDPAYDSGDRLHPGPLGMNALAGAVPPHVVLR